MSKTVDDLVKVFDETRPSPFAVVDVRAGVAAVIRALRDESGRRGYLNWDDLDQILGDAGNEKVAGGSTREDERSVEQLGATSSHAIRSPATDPAPAVCEWIATSIDPMGYAWMNSSCGLVDCHERDVLMQPNPQKHCPSCGKPIKFTEAK